MQNHPVDFKRFLAMSLTALSLLTSSAQVSNAQDRAVPPPVPVLTMRPGEDDKAPDRMFYGRVAARATVDLAFEVGGRIVTLDAVEGQRIAAGTVLAALDPDPYERAVARAELSLDQAERAFRRADTLAARDAASRARADDAETARDLAAVDLREARDARSDTRLVAPFDAILAKRIASVGALVSKGEPVVRLQDMSELRIDVELPERLLGRIGDPQEARFEAEIHGIDGPLDLAFREVRTETGEIGQSYTVSLAVAKADMHPWLLPGRSATVRAYLPKAETGVAVPATAVVTRGEGRHFVVAVEPDGDALVARHLPVEVAIPDGSTVRVEGLPANAEIVAVGGHLLEDGAPVSRYDGLIAKAE
ncbi:secretion protein HlyD [Rhodovulum sulfidophilum]|uniref:Secretion protein HlyD n=1 Tax=Rhodovulum sulfidophilum TaxID=35806 RepID=A0A0D6B2Y3_RHOSU|nr:secretion protein HlyD [Rhodovulum sulfidophilum]